MTTLFSMLLLMFSLCGGFAMAENEPTPPPGNPNTQLPQTGKSRPIFLYPKSQQDEPPQPIEDTSQATEPTTTAPTLTEPQTPPREMAPAQPPVIATEPLPIEVTSHIAREKNIAKLNDMGEWIARQALKASTAEERAIYVAAGNRVIEHIQEVAQQPTGTQASTTPHTLSNQSNIVPDCSQNTVCGYLMKINQDMTPLLKAGSVPEDTDDPFASLAYEVGRAAYETGRTQQTGATPSPRKSPVMSGTFKRQESIFDATRYYNEGQGTYRTSRRIEKRAPPPPTVSDKPKIKPKGVLISFNQDALMAAVGKGLSPLLIENQMLQATNEEALFATIDWSSEEAARLLMRGRKVRDLDDLVVVSLRELTTEAGKYRADWATLPKRLKYPGSLRRIFGYVVDETEQDVRLLGSSEGEGTPLSIDELIIGTDAVWRRGAEPMVSLEPDPNDMVGPHRAIVQGIPFDSQFAKVLLDADYEMKYVTLVGRGVSVPGFRPLVDLMISRGEQGSNLNRFWFTPAPPQAGDIITSPDGHLFLFDSRVILQTEGMLVRGGMMVGRGTHDNLASTVADTFTSNIAAFETNFPIIRELHGMMDITLMASLWRLTGLNLPVLDALADLPVTPTKVAQTYKGLHHKQVQGNISVTVAGGVNLAQGVTMGWVVPVASPHFTSFIKRPEMKAQMLSGHVAGTGLQAISASPQSSSTEKNPLLKASQKLAAGHNAHAYFIATRLLQENPFRADALSLRAEAALELELYQLTARDLHAVSALTQTSESVRLALTRVHILEGHIQEFDSLTAPDRQSLSELFLSAVVRRLTGGQNPDQSLSDIDIAIRLKPEEAAAYAMRAGLHLAAHRVPQGLEDLDRALELKPDSGPLYLMKTHALVGEKDYAGAVETATRGMPYATAENIFKLAMLRGLARTCVREGPDTCQELRQSMIHLAIQQSALRQTEEQYGEAHSP